MAIQLLEQFDPFESRLLFGSAEYAEGVSKFGRGCIRIPLSSASGVRGGLDFLTALVFLIYPLLVVSSMNSL